MRLRWRMNVEPCIELLDGYEVLGYISETTDGLFVATVGAENDIARCETLEEAMSELVRHCGGQRES